MPYNLLTAAAATTIPDTGIGDPQTSVGKTLAMMRTELSLMLAGRTDVTPERLNSWINDAYVDVWTSVEHDDAKGSLAFLTVPGQHLYLLPPEVMSTIYAAVVDPTHLAGGWKLHKTDLHNYRMVEDETGNPYSYFRHGRLLVLHPTPDKAVTVSVDFRSRPSYLVVDTDSPALGIEWHEVVLLGARAIAFDRLMEFDKAMPAENSFIAKVRRRQDTEANEDEARIVGSSAPRDAKMLNRRPLRTVEP